MKDRRSLYVVMAFSGLFLLGVLLLATSFPTSYDDPTMVLGEDAPPEFATSYEITDERVSRNGSGSERYHRQTFTVEAETLDYRAERNFFGFQEDVRSYVDVGENWASTRLATDAPDRIDLPSETLVRTERNGDEHVFVTAEPENASLAEQYEGFYSSFGAPDVLRHPDYEHRGQETYGDRTVEVYEPRDGWYERRSGIGPASEYRIIDSGGEAFVDSETGALLYADVSFTTVHASSYGEYVYQRTLGEKVFEYDLSWEFTEGGEVERPDWAEEPE